MPTAAEDNAAAVPSIPAFINSVQECELATAAYDGLFDSPLGRRPQSILPHLSYGALQDRVLQYPPVTSEGAPRRTALIGVLKDGSVLKLQSRRTEEGTACGLAAPRAAAVAAVAAKRRITQDANLHLHLQQLTPAAAATAAAAASVKWGDVVTRSDDSLLADRGRRTTQQTVPTIRPSVDGGNGHRTGSMRSSVTGESVARAAPHQQDGMSARYSVISRMVGLTATGSTHQELFKRYMQECLPVPEVDVAEFADVDAEVEQITATPAAPPESEDDEDVQLSGMLLSVPTVEPPAARATPAVFTASAGPNAATASGRYSAPPACMASTRFPHEPTSAQAAHLTASQQDPRQLSYNPVLPLVAVAHPLDAPVQLLSLPDLCHGRMRAGQAAAAAAAAAAAVAYDGSRVSTASASVTGARPLLVQDLFCGPTDQNRSMDDGGWPKGFKDYSQRIGVASGGQDLAIDVRLPSHADVGPSERSAAGLHQRGVRLARSCGVSPAPGAAVPSQRPLPMSNFAAELLANFNRLSPVRARVMGVGGRRSSDDDAGNVSNGHNGRIGSGGTPDRNPGTEPPSGLPSPVAGRRGGRPQSTATASSPVSSSSEAVRRLAPVTSTSGRTRRDSWTGGTDGDKFGGSLVNEPLHCVPSQQEVEDQVADLAADPENVGLYYGWGEVGRLLRRYNYQAGSHIFNLNHSMRGKHQMPAIVEVLSRVRDMHALLLENNDIDDASCGTLTATLLMPGSCSSLNCLDLGNNRLTAAAIFHLIDLIHPITENSRRQTLEAPPHAMLHELSLAGNAIGDAGAEVLFSVVGHGDSCLRVLDVRRCKITDKAATALKSMLEVTRHLRILHLGWNSLGLRGGRAIAEGISGNATVRELHLPWTGVSDAGAAHILKSLESNATLQVLDLSGNGASASSCAVLLEALRRNTSLQHLVLQDSALGTLGARKLLRAVQTGSLQHVDLRGCSFVSSYSPSMEFNPQQPNGCYSLNLADPAQFQTSLELLRLANEQGHDSWRNAKLNGKPFDVDKMTLESMPSSGTLTLEFKTVKKCTVSATPLDERSFYSVWEALIADGANAWDAAAFADGDREAAEEAATPSLTPGPRFAGSLLFAAGAPTRHNPTTDDWKFGLLGTLLTDCFFTSRQAVRIVEAFSYGQDKVEAAAKIFGHITDPEQFHVVLESMSEAQEEQACSVFGALRLFHPENPTGRYNLVLSHQLEYMVANRLLDFYKLQYDAGLVDHPHTCCFSTCTLNGEPLNTRNPYNIIIPKQGQLQVNFVDLRPAPQEAAPLTRHRFVLLLNMLMNEPRLDAERLAAVVDGVGVEAKVEAMARFSSWTKGHPVTAKVSYLQRQSAAGGPPVIVRDLPHFLESMRFFAVRHYLSCSQLIELLALLPEGASAERLELITMFWARVTDRRQQWSAVLRAARGEQVAVCQRLGYASCFDAAKPTMHYRLRMSRPDEHQVAWRLYRMALDAKHDAFSNMTVDGVEKKVSQGQGFWQVMRGNAAEGTTPTVTLDFDFEWPDTEKPHWAACKIQAGWRAYCAWKKTCQERGPVPPLSRYTRITHSRQRTPVTTNRRPPTLSVEDDRRKSMGTRPGTSEPYNGIDTPKTGRDPRGWQSLYGPSGSPPPASPNRQQARLSAVTPSRLQPLEGQWRSKDDTEDVQDPVVPQQRSLPVVRIVTDEAEIGSQSTL